MTGHTGFKGSWIAHWMIGLGAEVTGYALEPETTPNHYDLIKPEMRSFVGDIRDRDTLNTALHKAKPEIVIHMAAQPLVRRSYRDPIATYETNVIGTVNLLEACRHLPSVRAIVNVTSDKCYENREWFWGYRENDPMGGCDPYSASKGCAELVTSSYQHAFFSPKQYGKTHQTLLASCRAGNVIGGGDWSEDRLIPDIIRAVANNEKVCIRNPHATRPWQHVLEPLSGYLMLAKKLLEGDAAFAEGWNFGPSDEEFLTVQSVIERMKSKWNKVDYVINPSLEQPHEAGLLKLDSSKAWQKLQWRPVWNSEESSNRTIGWYRNYYEKGSLGTSDDLNAYITDAKLQGLAWARSS